MPASYTPTPEFSGNVRCRVALVEIGSLVPLTNFGSAEVSGTTTDNWISCSLHVQEGSYTSLKGYVILYPDPTIGNSNIFWNPNMVS